jgi:hypothetical protein
MEDSTTQNLLSTVIGSFPFNLTVAGRKLTFVTSE